MVQHTPIGIGSVGSVGSNESPAAPLSPERQAALERYKAAHEEELLKVLQEQSFISFGPEEVSGDWGYLRWQVGPQDAGRNGALLEEVLQILIDRIEFLQAVLYCQENLMISEHLTEALGWVRRRRELRDRAGVSGTTQQHWGSRSLHSYGWVPPEVPTELLEQHPDSPTGVSGEVGGEVGVDRAG